MTASLMLRCLFHRMQCHGELHELNIPSSMFSGNGYSPINICIEGIAIMNGVKSSILVTGATGKVGSALVALLRNEPSVEVIAAVRTPEKAARLGVPVVHLDFDRTETLEPAMRGIDRVFMMTGYTVDMFRQSKAFVNAAK